MISFDIEKSGSCPTPAKSPYKSSLLKLGKVVHMLQFFWLSGAWQRKLLIPTWLVFNHLSPYRTRCYRRSLNPIFYFRLNFYTRESKIKLTLTCEPDEVTDNWCDFGLRDTDFCYRTTVLLQVHTFTSQFFLKYLGCITFLVEKRRNETRWYEIFTKIQ